MYTYAILFSFLCVIAYIIFRKLDVHPILAGFIIILEIGIYVGLALGFFANDILWMLGFSTAIYLLARLPKKYLLTRYKGILLFVAYAVFMVLIFIKYH